jgi:hypothetical protein
MTGPKKSWLDRSELASLFIRDGDTVCDLGCGKQGLKKFLPDNTHYIPVDLRPAAPGTILIDLNDDNFELPEAEFNVITALGLLNWLDDPAKFFDRLVEICPGRLIIFTYDFWKRRDDTSCSFSEFKDGSLFFSRYVRNLTAAAVFRRRVMFTGNLGSGDPSLPARASATRLACRYIRPQEYLAIKLLDLEILPRWLA